jgi:2-dehydropantoate 2-reductase
VRKRRTEVDPQLGIVVALGREAGVAAPALAKLVELIHALEENRKPMAYATFEQLIEVAERRG